MTGVPNLIWDNPTFNQVWNGDGNEFDQDFDGSKIPMTLGVFEGFSRRFLYFKISIFWAQFQHKLTKLYQRCAT